MLLFFFPSCFRNDVFFIPLFIPPLVWILNILFLSLGGCLYFKYSHLMDKSTVNISIPLLNNTSLGNVLPLISPTRIIIVGNFFYYQHLDVFFTNLPTDFFAFHCCLIPLLPSEFCFLIDEVI